MDFLSKMQMSKAFVIANRGWKANCYFLQNVWNGVVQNTKRMRMLRDLHNWSQYTHNSKHSVSPVWWVSNKPAILLHLCSYWKRCWGDMLIHNTQSCQTKPLQSAKIQAHAQHNKINFHKLSMPYFYCETKLSHKQHNTYPTFSIVCF